MGAASEEPAIERSISVRDAGTDTTGFRQIPTDADNRSSGFGGCGGVRADLKTFAAHVVFGTTAITAITAQNTLGVTEVFPIPEDLVTAQIQAVVTDIGADATKIGMLATAGIAAAVAREIRRHDLPHVVL